MVFDLLLVDFHPFSVACDRNYATKTAAKKAIVSWRIKFTNRLIWEQSVKF